MCPSLFPRGQLYSIFAGASNVVVDRSIFNVVQGNQLQCKSWYKHMRFGILQSILTYCRTISDWLSPLNFKVTQSDVFEQRVDGTGRWLFESQEFRAWLEGTSETLWCPGMREMLPN